MTLSPTDDAPPHFDAAGHLDAMAPTLGLTITPEQRPGVLQFLATAQVMFQLANSAPLADDSFEIAPVFRPGLPGDAS